jgi:ATP-binding cassette subfamily F protein 3
MDEPTTHLDLASIDALIGALRQFEGTLAFISHDVHFIRQLSTHTVHVKNGRLRNFPGGYDYYLHKTKKENAAQPATNGSAPKPTNKSEDRARKRAEAEARNARSRKRQKIEKEVHRLEKEIQTAEAKITELTAELENPETYENPARAVAINRDLTTAQTTLDCLTPEWEKAAGKLEAFE